MSQYDTQCKCKKLEEDVMTFQFLLHKKKQASITLRWKISSMAKVEEAEEEEDEASDQPREERQKNI